MTHPPPSSEVVVDIGQKSFKALGFRKMNILSLAPLMISKPSRDAISKVNKAWTKEKF